MVVGIILIVIGTIDLLFALFAMSTWDSNYMNSAVIMHFIFIGVSLYIGINLFTNGLEKFKKSDENK